MSCTEIEHILVDYIDGLLTSKETEVIKEHITTCSRCEKALYETTQLMQSFTEEPIVEPSAKLRASFEQMLQEEKQKQTKVITLQPIKKKSYITLLQVAASVAILFTGYLIGGYQESSNSQKEITAFKNEQQQLKENMMLAMIDNTSPSTRIKAVNYTDEFTTAEPKILKALIERMQHDSNSNVRLSAAEALAKFTDSELVKTALIETLTTEKNPSIQIEIIQILVNIQEKRALDPMKKLLEQPELPDYVKTQLNIGIAHLI
ncbi:MAG: HEAT repeat domain-containing protein [Flavobacteriaceae bacterium]|nr:HEAT repeat domain-containing protein [Flavobacteriaceae bacterium]